VQHELVTGLGLTVAYFRTSWGNLHVTDNLAVGPEDYDTFCISAPNDPRLLDPGARVCGLLAIKPEKFGVQNNVVRLSKHYGDLEEIHNGVDITLNARFGNGGLLTGGVSMGKTTIDSCEILSKLPEMTTAAITTLQSAGTPLGADPLRASPQTVCRVDPPLSAGTQFKLAGAYNLPWDLRLSASYQNNPGIETTATYVATNAEIVPSIGRNLAACRGVGACTATANVELIRPLSLYREGRITQLNFAVNRVFRVGTANVQPRFELHNALNSASILATNLRYGPQWEQVRTVLTPMMAKFALQIDF
jgi:hypothetical protein